MIQFHLFYNLSFIILYFFFLCYLLQNSLQSLIYGKFPKVKKLPSGDYFIIFDKGINIYNKNFSLNKTLYNFTGDEIIQEADFEKTIISDFKTEKNNYYILCLINGKYLYIIDKYYNIGQIIISFINQGEYYNLIPYKYNETSLQYIICFIFKNDDNYNLYFSFFKINLSFQNFNNTLTQELSFCNEINCTDHIRNSISNFIMLSQISYLEYKKLTNFFSVYEGCEKDTNKTGLKIDSYNLDDNQWTDINLTPLSLNIIDDIKTSIPNKNNECLVCYREIFKASCLIYNIKGNFCQNNKFDIWGNCIQIDIYFFEENEQYIVLCKTNDDSYNHEFKALIFNNDFTHSFNFRIFFSINKCKEIKSYSLIFCYSFIYDCINDSNESTIEYNNTLFNFDNFPKNPIDSTLYTSL